MVVDSGTVCVFDCLSSLFSAPDFLQLVTLELLGDEMCTTSCVF